MIKGIDFIVFSDDWGRHPSSCQHIMEHIIPYNRVLWVNTIGMRSPRFCIYDFKRGFEKIFQWFHLKEHSSTDVEMSKHLTVINPFMIPLSTIPPIRSFNQYSVITAVRKCMNSLAFFSPVVVATLPNAADYAGAFGERGLVYYCVDDFTEWPGVNRQFVESLEKDLLQRADLVFASADELCRRKVGWYKGSPILLPHGVNFRHFHEGADRARMKAIFDRFPRPVVGFFGAISPWLDFELILYAARMKREWSFVFLGPVDTDVSTLQKEPNIHLLGKIPYAELPAYASHFDVGTIPFLVNDMTMCVNPLKLLEYFACGIPVVSTDLPEVAKYGKVAAISSSKEEYVTCLNQVILEDSDCKREIRKRIAAENSWASRAEMMSREVERF